MKPKKDISGIGFSTKAIHVGQDPDPANGAIIPPIYLSSTYIQEGPGITKGYDYSRSGNPTRDGLELCVAALENGAGAVAFSSGLAAIAGILETLPPRSHIIATDDIYGGSYRLFERVKKLSQEISITFTDMSDPRIIESFIKPETKLIWVETPTNPLLRICDLEAIASIGKKHNLICACDNTFASPYLQNPLTMGFDLAVHSSTKYLNGHSDVIGGVIVVRERGELLEKVRFIQNAVGAVPSPFDCYLTQRGIKTLPLRMERHCSNAMMIADFLCKHPAVQEVIYPGLSSHPQHAIAKKQMRYFGGMISIVVHGGISNAVSILKRASIFSLAESLGGVESLIEHPATMTHASIPIEQRQASGIADGLIRLSVGTEDVADLIADLHYALG